MPARVIRSEINSSESLSQVSLEADLTFRSLLVAVDDYGRIDGRIPVLKGLLFPLRPSVTPKRIEGWLAELAALDDPPILIYHVDGRCFIQLTGWETHRGKSNRAATSKYPAPDSGRSAEIRENPGNPPVGMESGVWSRGTGNEGREGSPGDPGESPSAPPASPATTVSKANGKSRRTLVPKPEAFPPESLARLKAWGDKHGFGKSVLNAGLEAFREWVPVKPPYSRPIETWEGAFKKITRDCVADGKVSGDSKPKGLAYAEWTGHGDEVAR